MISTRQQTKRTADGGGRKTEYVIPDTRKMIERIDGIIRELETMRCELITMPKATPMSGLTQELFGAAGKGTREEYDLDLYWTRFSE